MKKLFRRSSGSGSKPGPPDLHRLSATSAVSSSAQGTSLYDTPNCVLASSPVIRAAIPQIPPAEPALPMEGVAPVTTAGTAYTSLSQIQAALRRSGLESSNLIAAIDFTASNDESGRYSFHGLSLHDLTARGGPLNPYEAALKAITHTLSAFDDDDQIPAYGFGDAASQEWFVFSFFENDRPANGFEELLRQYRALVPHVKKAGPTCFAPVIKQAMKIVENSGFQYHVLVIIADGQVTRPTDTAADENSLYEDLTIEAIREASHYPLSIVLVGVGDGPWDTMETFDSRLTGRQFDNFRFVNFTQLQAETRNLPKEQQEARFALEALRELPEQYRYIKDHNMMGDERDNPPRLPEHVDPLPPPEVPLGLQPIQTRIFTPTQAADYLHRMNLQAPTLATIASVQAPDTVPEEDESLSNPRLLPLEPPEGPPEGPPASLSNPGTTYYDAPVIRIGRARANVGYGTQVMNTTVLEQEQSPFMVGAFPPNENMPANSGNQDTVMLHSGPLPTPQYAHQAPNYVGPPRSVPRNTTSFQNPNWSSSPPRHEPWYAPKDVTDYGAPEYDPSEGAPGPSGFPQGPPQDPNYIAFNHGGRRTSSGHSHSGSEGGRGAPRGPYAGSPRVTQGLMGSYLRDHGRSGSTHFEMPVREEDVGVSAFEEYADGASNRAQGEPANREQLEHVRQVNAPRVVGLRYNNDSEELLPPVILQLPPEALQDAQHNAQGGEQPNVQPNAQPDTQQNAQQAAQEGEQQQLPQNTGQAAASAAQPGTAQSTQQGEPQAGAQRADSGQARDGFLRELFECPITLEIMHDPVMAMDGRTYERDAIAAYIARQGLPCRSPISGEVITSNALIPNYALRSSILEWRQRTGYDSTFPLVVPPRHA